MVDDTKFHILERLVRNKFWGGKHTPLKFVIHGLSEKYNNTHQGRKAIGKALKELLNLELISITMKMTGEDSDKHISLNPRKVGEIMQLIERFDSKQ